MSPMIDEIYPYSYWNVISSLNPTWKERDKNLDELFGKAVALSREILLREIERARHFVEGRTFVEQAYDSAEDKRLIILDAEYSWSDILINKDEPIFVVGPNLEEKQWRVLAVRIDAHSFKNRKDLPKSWGGKHDEELALETGVSDATFCHNNLFIAAARSKEGAIRLAKLAIEK